MTLSGYGIFQMINGLVSDEVDYKVRKHSMTGSLNIEDLKRVHPKTKQNIKDDCDQLVENAKQAPTDIQDKKTEKKSGKLVNEYIQKNDIKHSQKLTEKRTCDKESQSTLINKEKNGEKQTSKNSKVNQDLKPSVISGNVENDGDCKSRPNDLKCKHSSKTNNAEMFNQNLYSSCNKENFPIRNIYIRDKNFNKYNTEKSSIKSKFSKIFFSNSQIYECKTDENWGFLNDRDRNIKNTTIKQMNKNMNLVNNYGINLMNDNQKTSSLQSILKPKVNKGPTKLTSKKNVRFILKDKNDKTS